MAVALGCGVAQTGVESDRRWMGNGAHKTRDAKLADISLQQVLALLRFVRYEDDLVTVCLDLAHYDHGIFGARVSGQLEDRIMTR